MYYEPWEYIWETEKKHLDYEIGKAEGQLKNCRFRIGLAKREMIVGCFCVFAPLLLIMLMGSLSSSGSLIGNLLVAAGLTFGLVFQVLYMCLLPFLAYYMIKGMMLYLMNTYEPVKEEALKLAVRSEEPVSEPEKSYAVEEGKLMRALSRYYEYRSRMEQFKWQLSQGEITMTAEELQAELGRWVYYEEIVPADPFSKKMAWRARLYTVAVCAVVLLLLRICL